MYIPLATALSLTATASLLCTACKPSDQSGDKSQVGKSQSVAKSEPPTETEAQRIGRILSGCWNAQRDADGKGGGHLWGFDKDGKMGTYAVLVEQPDGSTSIFKLERDSYRIEPNAKSAKLVIEGKDKDGKAFQDEYPILSFEPDKNSMVLDMKGDVLPGANPKVVFLKISDNPNHERPGE